MGDKIRVLNFRTNDYEYLSLEEITPERALDFVPQDFAAQGLLKAALWDVEEGNGGTVAEAVAKVCEFIGEALKSGHSVREMNAVFN